VVTLPHNAFTYASMRAIWTLAITGLALIAQPADAQERARLEVSLKSLQATLNGQGQLSWVQTTRSTSGGQASSVNVTAKVAEANVDAKSCVLTFRLERSFPNYRIDLSWTLPLRDIGKVEVSPMAEFANRTSAAGGHPERILSTDAPVVLVQVHAERDGKFAAHRWSVNSDKQVIERDERISPASFLFNTEESAKSVANALLNARDHCRQKE